MKLITERTQVREVSARWERSYPLNGPYGCNPQRQAITKALAALDVETATAADVAAIIGNNSWCGPQKCHECGALTDVSVQVGEEPSYESRTATLCFACVEKALALMGPNVKDGTLEFITSEEGQKPFEVGSQGLSENQSDPRAVEATWSLELTCHCPQCGEYVDLLRYPDFWDGRQSMQACEHGTPRTTGMEVNCPNCDAEFEVDCQY